VVCRLWALGFWLLPVGSFSASPIFRLHDGVGLTRVNFADSLSGCATRSSGRIRSFKSSCLPKRDTEMSKGQPRPAASAGAPRLLVVRLTEEFQDLRCCALSYCRVLRVAAGEPSGIVREKFGEAT